MNGQIIIGVVAALLALVAAVQGTIGAVGPPIQAEIATETVRKDVFPKTSAHFADGIVGQPDVEYANIVGFRPLQLDLYTHERSGAQARPLVIWIHGGGWNRGDSRTSAAFANFPAVLASLAARGYVVASINYRLSGEARFPAAIQDVKAAIRYLRANAAQFGIDPARVILWGGSAGGHLAALAATSCGVAAFEPSKSTGRSPTKATASAVDPPVFDCVQGAVIWYGVFDFATISSSRISHVADFLGCHPRDCLEAAALASPVSHITPSGPPMLLIHGTADKTAPLKQSEEMAERLRKAGVPVETLFIPDVGHGWIGANPAATRKASLLALQRTFDYIDAIVAAKSK
ncbi:MAG: alpha/beta hydrolase [Terriglobales bacterium]|jgi:acetyl esterase/lipase